MKCVMLTAVLALGLWGCSKKPDAQGYTPLPVPVETSAIDVRDVPLFIESMGTLRAARTAEVKPRVTGMIEAVHFAEGQWVEAGALLYTIDEAPYALRVQEAEAVLAQNQANLLNARKKLERYNSLSKQDLIARVEWEALETQISLAQAQVQGDEARLAAAKLDFEHCKIFAPIAGRAGKTALQSGNMVSGDTLVTLAQASPLHVDFSITERELQQLSTYNCPVEIYAPGSDELVATGRLAFLDHTIDPQSGMIALRAVLTKTYKRLWPGQSVRAHLIFGKKAEAKMIPLRAIKTNQSGPFVFSVKEDNTVEMRSIKLGAECKDLVVVEEGLDASDRIVTQGQSRLFPGSKVEEVKP